MNLAKNHIDVGLFSNQRDAQLAFWQGPVSLPYDHLGKLGGGMQQHRHHMNGSILKMNHAREPLPALPPSGIVEVLIARDDLDTPRHLIDPDGNRVTLVPKGCEGVVGVGVVLRVNNRDATDRFYRHVMQFEAAGRGVYRCGDSLVIVGEEGKVEKSAEWRAPGYRYTTVQIWDAAKEHAGILARGGEEGAPLRVLGETVRYSFVRDPDGNFIEISQRASLTGGHL
jgi:lactoylglutathione lyase